MKKVLIIGVLMFAATLANAQASAKATTADNNTVTTVRVGRAKDSRAQIANLVATAPKGQVTNVEGLKPRNKRKSALANKPANGKK